jgi:hypothetical protein
MIALKRRRANRSVPASFREPRVTATARILVDLYYKAQPDGRIAFDSKHWKPAKAALKKDTGGKCAYCEAPTDVVAFGDVEHFRPKSKYWWLAFCFDNYLYSCQICNQAHKQDRFPIGGRMAAAPAMPRAKPTGAALDALVAALVLDASRLTDADVSALWTSEAADLINPYLEDPAPLLAYEVDDVNEEIWLRSAGGPRADRAAAAADACLGINREELRRERYVNYLTLAAFKAILDEEIASQVRSIAESEVRRMQGPQEPFAGMRRYFAAQWGLPGPA